MAGVESIKLNFFQDSNVSAKESVKGMSADNVSKQFEKMFSNQKSADAKKSDISEEISGEQKVYVKNTKEIASEDTASQAVMKESSSKEDVTLEELQQLNENLRREIIETFKLDPEELDQLMADMGIVITDLLKPDVLQNFILQVTGGEGNLDFVMNESMLTMFQDLLQRLTDMVSREPENVIALMEVLENPIALDEEFVQSLSGNMGDAQQDINNQNADALFATGDNQAETDASVVVKQSAVEDGQKLGKVSDIVEKVEINNEEQAVTDVDGTDAQTQDDFSQNASDEESGTSLLFEQRPVDNGVVKGNSSENVVANAFQVVQGNIHEIYQAGVNETARMQQMIDIVSQVRNQIQESLSATNTTLEMQLNPESLGKVLLTVTSKEGVMTANFQVQSEEAKNALESQMYQLKETLEAKNIKVESVDVQISDFSFDHSNEANAENQQADKQSKKKFNFDVADESEENVVEETAEETRHRVSMESGASVDYTA